MADFIVYLGLVRDGLRDLFAQERAVALPEAMDKTFYGRFGYSQCLRQGRVGDIFTLGAQAGTQRFKSAQFSLAFAFLAETSQSLFYDCRGPA